MTYIVYATNAARESQSVNDGKEFNSLKVAVSAAKWELNSSQGWIVHILNQEGREVRRFQHR